MILLTAALLTVQASAYQADPVAIATGSYVSPIGAQGLDLGGAGVISADAIASAVAGGSTGSSASGSGAGTSTTPSSAPSTPGGGSCPDRPPDTTRTLACSGGLSGSVLMRLNYTCSGGNWMPGEWSVGSDSCPTGSGAISAPSGSASEVTTPEGGLQPPTDCAPKRWGALMVYRAQRCIFQPPQEVDGGHAPVTFGAEGSGIAYGFRPHASSADHISIVGTPAVYSSQSCEVELSIIDASGDVVGAPSNPCTTSTATNDNGAELIWSTMGSGRFGCQLTAGQQYYARLTLKKRVTDPVTGISACGLTIDATTHVDD